LQVAIYRKGTLDLVIPPGSIRQYLLNSFNTFRLIFPFLGAAIVGIFAAFAGKDWKFLERAMAFSGGCLAAAICASMAWTRILCSHFYLPRRSGSRMEYAMFSGKHPSTAILRDPRQAVLLQQAAEVRRQRAEKLQSRPPETPPG
jgi:hypothetical protein